MIRFEKQPDRLLLRYQPDNGQVDWIDDLLQQEKIEIRKVFRFGKQDLLTEETEDYFSDDQERIFVLGDDDGEYYKINKDILNIKWDLRLFKRMGINIKTFIATNNISVFKKIDNLIEEPLVIGGNYQSAVSVKDFNNLLKNFPTATELKHYANSRIARVLKDYLQTISDHQKKLENYLQKKKTISTPSRMEFLLQYEPKKFEYVRDELKSLLDESDVYDEKDWQKLIVDFLLVIFPKYIAVLENLHIKDFYSNPKKTKNRYIDLTLVDSNGTIDIVEIKKPFANCILSSNKYRDNYTPKKELSGSVMQVEKYIFHLNKWGRAGELDILKKQGSKLPPNFEIKITNPKAMIILGRDKDFADGQRFDFEIIRRKYSNVIDIMTYDDLLRRLDNIIAMMDRNFSKLKIETGQA